jgi:hypothetical protein
MRATNGRYVVRDAGGFRATATDVVGAEPFYFHATDLGSYLLYTSKSDFLAVSDGATGTALDAVADSPEGGIASGLTIGLTGRVATPIATGALGSATGRGAGIVAAPAPSDLSDWEIDDAGHGAFTLRLAATNQFLVVQKDGRLAPADAPQSGPSTLFGFRLTGRCASFPEIEINVDGPVAHGDSPFSEARGYVDLHVHMMAFEFIGGAVRCGRPWHPYGVAYALVDCPDHMVAGGRGAVLEDVLSGGTPGSPHDPHGWPSFAGWPQYNNLTQEQLYYRWLERAWRGGLRVFNNLLVDNHALCTAYPLKKHGCNEMDGIRRQAMRIHQLQDYIDAQEGGPGEGWFRIVTDPFQARRVINEGKLAVVLGIETSLPFDCGEVLGVPQCDERQIDDQLDEVYALGVRDMLLGNKFDNALAGITGDAGTTGVIVNSGNKLETGRYWAMRRCTPFDEGGSDKTQMNIHDDARTPDELTGRDSIFAGVLEVAGATGVAPAYPPGPQCNVRGLTPLGAYAIRGMIKRHMIFDPDHISARARHAALEVVDEAHYSGIESSHSWSDDTVYPRVYKLGGFETPYAGSSQGFVNEWRQRKQWADPRFPFGIGYGSDINGFGAQGAPRGANAPNKVTYPFSGFGGTTIYRQHSGTRLYDINTDGVAHYGLYPDWIEDLRHLAGQAIIDDMQRGPEAYLEMWERGYGVPGNPCRPDVPDLTATRLSSLKAGITPRQVLFALGQPASRAGLTFGGYCMRGGRTATVTFSAGGRLTDVRVA